MNLTAPMKRALLDAQYTHSGGGQMRIPDITPMSVRRGLAARGMLASDRHVWLLQPALDMLPTLRAEPYPARVRCKCLAWREPDRSCKWCKANGNA